MKLLEFLHKVDEDILLEAAKDRYLQMFQNLPHPSEEYIEFQDMDKKIADQVNWAIKTFKKSSAITWYLRYYRIFLLQSIASKPSNDNSQEEWAVKAKQMYAKEIRRIGAKSGLGDNIANYAGISANPRTMLKFEHYMSLPIDGIQNYPFEWQSPSEVITDFDRMEREWQESRKRMVPQRSEQTIVLPFEDGSAWVNLHKAGCAEEGAAMGHCGNDPTQREGQTVLSYRTKEVDDDGNPAWKPHLTFIFDTITGYIGEMKGRNNNKPDKKYHKVIMELLKLPMIKGIVGGGYKPENNFRMSDLSEEQFEYMSELKPELLDPYDQYLMNDREVSQELVDKLEEMLVTDLQLSFNGYDEKNNVFVLDNNVGNAEDVYGAYNESISVYLDDDDTEKLSVDIMEKYLGKDELAALARYFNMQYPQEDPIKDSDLDNAGKIYSALKDESDDVTDVFEESIKEILDGIAVEDAEYGIEQLPEYAFEADYADSGVYLDLIKNDNYRIVASPEEFLENGLPKANADTNWMDMTGAMYLQDPSERIHEELFSDYGDDDYKERVSQSITDVIKKQPAYQKAIQYGENPGMTGERLYGQQRLFADKGIDK